MKKYGGFLGLLFVLMFSGFIYGATPALVPDNAGEGSIGTSLKPWGDGYYNTLTISKTGDIILNIISTDFEASYIIFQRGTSSDAYTDFRIGGKGKLLISWRTTGAFTDIADYRINYIELMVPLTLTPTTFAFTEDTDLPTELLSSTYLLDGDNDSDNDILDLQNGTRAGQIIHLIAAVDIDADDTVTINMADTTCTNCPAIVFDKIGENAELKWSGSTWSVKSLQDAL